MWSNVEGPNSESNSTGSKFQARKTLVEDATAPDGAAPVLVPISSLVPADSPWLTGENLEHVKLLAMARNLPPILVQRSTMRVIDGMHRVRAAQFRGETAIPVTFFEGDDSEVFLRAVDANIKHGLTLSLTDREAAADRILVDYPHWSDRTVAAASGLSRTTVGAIRRRSGGPAQRRAAGWAETDGSVPCTVRRAGGGRYRSSPKSPTRRCGP